MSELFSNNAVSTLTGSLSAVATSLTVQAGHGARFPNPTASDFFRLVLVRKSDGAIEIAFCTVRSGDIFTITRAQESTTALAFVASDIVELRPTAGFFTSLTVTSSSVQNNQFSYDATDTGSANVCVIQPSPAIAAYVEGQEFWWKVGVTNTGPSTLNVSSLGTSPAIILQNGSALYAGALQATRIAHVIYDGTAWVLLNPYNVASAVETLTNKTLESPVLNGSLSGTAIGRGALAYLTSAQSIPNNTYTHILLNAEIWDSDGVHSIVSNTDRVVVPAGVSRVNLAGFASFTISTTGVREFAICKNPAAASFATATGLPMLSFGNLPAIAISANLMSADINVVPGDYFTLTVLQNSGAPLNIDNIDLLPWLQMRIIK